MDEEKKDEESERANRPLKRETKQRIRLRNNRFVAFLLHSYYEIRYKVTWPTFEEARKMTAIVILLSGVVSAILALADAGLLKLFQLITGTG